MEIREILETSLLSNNLEVKFRIDEDQDDVIRTNRKSTRLNSSHVSESRMPSSA